jgi:hypothetical protein
VEQLNKAGKHAAFVSKLNAGMTDRTDILYCITTISRTDLNQALTTEFTTIRRLQLQNFTGSTSVIKFVGTNTFPFQAAK